MSSTPKIAIIGAGPAGLTLARLLSVSKAKVEVTVFEADASPASRQDQGGTLDLHTGTGLSAIRKCGLWDQFSRFARYDGQEMIMADKNGTVLVHLGVGKTTGDRPEIDRKDLKSMLLESLPPGTVRWSHRFKVATSQGLLCFDGREESEGPFDLIVGADGAWSSVRKALHQDKPTYAGVSGYELEIHSPSTACSKLNDMVGRGSYIGTSDAKMLNAQRMGDGHLKVRSWFLCLEGEAEETLNKYGKTGTLDIVRERYKEWDPEMTELLRQAQVDTLRLWTLYELPVGSKWEHKKGLTMIGDAASLATPFSGEGVNKAMVDALELAEMIEKSMDQSQGMTLDEAVICFEKQMFPRSEKLQRLTMANKLAVFREDAPVGTITAMLATLTSESSPLVKAIVGSAPFLALVTFYFWMQVKTGWAIRKYWRRT
ncbi:FAD/NAD(P)-binding domain-containing protein [Tothia fuscella]|uniref:FAD/NAD(P)-binding domain-containing protein n=1 Tax=Tothia fuscella TaxID=1048955 RepID=A0A9P4NSQ4_9PEZI|nr:FAD/NAD(P)-binding domain-containing protein [Tothia fuscella]